MPRRPEPDDEERTAVVWTLILAALIAAALGLAFATVTLAFLPAWRTAAELADCTAVCVEIFLPD